MFETAELGRTMSKKDFKKAAPVLRKELLELQDELHSGRQFQTIMVFAGVDGAGKGETVSLLNAWMDPRWLITRAYDDLRETDREWPEFRKYWRDLPPRGRIGMFLSAWYSRPVLDHVYAMTDEATFLKRLDRIVRFERALARDGALILKFWMHLSRDAQEQRLKSLEQDPLTKARVTERDWQHWQLYDKFIDTAEQVITRSNRGIAPWTVIEGAEANYRGITVATILRDELARRLKDVKSQRAAVSKQNKKKAKKSDDPSERLHSTQVAGHIDHPDAHAITVLSRLDMSQTIASAPYEEKLLELQARLHKLHLRAKAKKISSILVFEGPDAAGKGGRHPAGQRSAGRPQLSGSRHRRADR